MTKKKIYVLDTSVLIGDPSAIYAFGDNAVVIPTQVIEELDDLKDAQGEKGKNTCRAIRNIYDLRKFGNLFDGVQINGSDKTEAGELYVYGVKTSVSADRNLFDQDKTDNVILRMTADIAQNGIKDGSRKAKYKDCETILVTTDLCMGIKADVMRVTVEMYDCKTAADEEEHEN